MKNRLDSLGQDNLITYEDEDKDKEGAQEIEEAEVDALLYLQNGQKMKRIVVMR